MTDEFVELPALEDRPLVTFALFAFNQERYIREAVEGALAQDYSNLEIILSDDASVDTTWEIIKEVADNYQGPHKIILNRNRVNAGIAGHLNKIFSMAHGRLVVVAAGDDISHAKRVSETVTAWAKSGFTEAMIHGKANLINANGERLGIVKGRNERAPESPCVDDFIRIGLHALAHGATAAYTPKIFNCLGDLDCDFEDVPLTFRALLLGKLIYVDNVLIDYRVGIGNASGHLKRSDRLRIERWCDAQISKLDQHLNDYRLHCVLIGESVPRVDIISAIEKVKRRFGQAKGLASNNWLKNIFGLFALPMQGNFRDRLYVAAVYYGIKK